MRRERDSAKPVWFAHLYPVVPVYHAWETGKDWDGRTRCGLEMWSNMLRRGTGTIMRESHALKFARACGRCYNRVQVG